MKEQLFDCKLKRNLSLILLNLFSGNLMVQISNPGFTLKIKSLTVEAATLVNLHLSKREW